MCFQKHLSTQLCSILFVIFFSKCVIPVAGDNPFACRKILLKCDHPARGMRCQHLWAISGVRYKMTSLNPGNRCLLHICPRWVSGGHGMLLSHTSDTTSHYHIQSHNTLQSWLDWLNPWPFAIKPRQPHSRVTFCESTWFLQEFKNAQTKLSKSNTEEIRLVH